MFTDGSCFLITAAPWHSVCPSGVPAVTFTKLRLLELTYLLVCPNVSTPEPPTVHKCVKISSGDQLCQSCFRNRCFEDDLSPSSGCIWWWTTPHWYKPVNKYKIRGLSPRANYTYRATNRRPLVSEVSANFCGQRASRGQRYESLPPYSRFSRPEPVNIYVEKLHSFPYASRAENISSTSRTNLSPSHDECIFPIRFTVLEVIKHQCLYDRLIFIRF
jgi:hypothetical protein